MQIRSDFIITDLTKEKDTDTHFEIYFDEQNKDDVKKTFLHLAKTITKDNSKNNSQRKSSVTIMCTPINLYTRAQTINSANWSTDMVRFFIDEGLRTGYLQQNIREQRKKTS